MFCICQSNYRINQPTPTFTSNSPNLFIISGIGVAYRNLLYLLKLVYLLRVIKVCYSRLSHIADIFTSYLITVYYLTYKRFLCIHFQCFPDKVQGSY